MKQNSGIIIERVRAPREKVNACSALLGGVYLAGFLFALEYGQSPWAGIAVAAICYVAAFLLFGTRLYALAAGTFFALALLLALWGRLRLGAAAWLNPLLKGLSAKHGHIYLPYEAETTWLQPFLCYAAAVLAFLSAWGVRRQPWLLCLPAAALAFGCAFGLFQGTALLPVSASLLLLALTKGRGGWRSLLWTLPALCVSVSVFLSLLRPLAALQSNLSAELSYTAHQLRYDSTSSFPEGRLQKLGAKKTDGTALTLTLEQPQKLYLRGFIGQRYTGQSWTNLNTEGLADSCDLFYHLHKEGFTAQTQTGRATDAALKTAPVALTVETQDACSYFAYLPVGTTQYAFADDAAYPDAATRAVAKTYTLQYQPGGLVQWYATQAAFADGKGDSAYLRCESAYRKFVYQNYLELPQTAAQSLAQLLPKQTEALRLPELQARIRAVLDESFQYDESVVTDCGKADFVSYALTATGRGYSVHYATLAACLLRYYGVPSRYVEGYYLSSQEAQTLSAGQSFALDAGHAHAWAEFYLDGVGWLPFEVTPGYIDGEETALQGMLNDPNSTLYSTTAQTYAPRSYTPPQAYVRQPEEKSGHWRSPIHWRLPLWLLPCIVLLCLFAVCLLRRRRLRRHLRQLLLAPPEEAIVGLFAYSRRLCLKTGGSMDTPEWRRAAGDNREALFSGHTMTQTQKEAMSSFARQVQTECRRRRSIPKQLCDRWIRCLY